jgi:hypothetical protein
MTAANEGSGTRKPRPLDIVRPGDGDPRHGSPSTYTNHRCRCDPCRSAQADYQRDLRRRRLEALAAD